ncbi:UNVERIFIED_CONTAM: hypothetical protein HHA_456140 [Hammondia hammondi]|eukprot:XP_008888924.1 hypothetical protein HHA_456140 [Hammondia hammondi]
MQHFSLSHEVPARGVTHGIRWTTLTHSASDETASIANDLPQLGACVACLLLSPTTGEGLCQIAEAKDVGIRQEASLSQAEVVAAVEEDPSFAVIVADEHCVTTKGTLSSLVAH